MIHQPRKQNALWFSRHEPSLEQVHEAEANGANLIITTELIELAAWEIETEDDADRVTDELLKIAKGYRAHDVYGVFPVPLLHKMALVSLDAVSRGKWYSDPTTLPLVRCHASWLTPLEEHPIAAIHRKFLWVGYLTSEKQTRK